MGKKLNDNDVKNVSGGNYRKTYRVCPICKELNDVGNNQWLYSKEALRNHMKEVHNK